MSTRATYFIDTELEGGLYPSQTFYIHHDGYPDGAAKYFYKAIDELKRMGFAAKFFHANEMAEMIHSYNRIGDTRYHYHLEKEWMLCVYYRDWNSPWQFIERIPLENFINSQYNDAVVFRYKGPFNIEPCIFTKDILIKTIENYLGELSIKENNDVDQQGTYSMLIERIIDSLVDGYKNFKKDYTEEEVRTWLNSSLPEYTEYLHAT